MDGFSLTMAMVDAVPVIFFGAGMVITAARVKSLVIILGAVLTFLGGLCKVTWKFLLSVPKKNLRALNKPAFPMMISGMALILIGIVMDFSKIPWPSFLSLPAGLFFALWILLLGVMGVYKKKYFDHTSKANWTAQCINCLAQLFLLLAAITLC